MRITTPVFVVDCEQDTAPVLVATLFNVYHFTQANEMVQFARVKRLGFFKGSDGIVLSLVQLYPRRCGCESN